MASSLKKLISSFLLVLYSTTIIVASLESRCRRFKSIISFGDSIADTGNYLHLSDVNHLPQTAFLPYGESFFHPPSGRASNGRLMIDFIGSYFFHLYRQNHLFSFALSLSYVNSKLYFFLIFCLCCLTI